jgi:hypothetical protein
MFLSTKDLIRWTAKRRKALILAQKRAFNGEWQLTLNLISSKAIFCGENYWSSLQAH